MSAGEVRPAGHGDRQSFGDGDPGHTVDRPHAHADDTPDDGMAVPPILVDMYPGWVRPDRTRLARSDDAGTIMP